MHQIVEYAGLYSAQCFVCIIYIVQRLISSWNNASRRILQHLKQPVTTVLFHHSLDQKELSICTIMRIFSLHFLLLCAASVHATSSQNNTVTTAPAVTVVDLFLGAKRPGNYFFVASVISVGETATTFEVVCSSGLLNLPGFPTTTCNTNDPVGVILSPLG